MTSDPTRDALAALAVRYEAGIEWLKAHDPEGSFFFWHQSGIQPHHPMPAQSEDRREEYRAYCQALRLWQALDRKLFALERKAAAAAGGS